MLILQAVVCRAEETTKLRSMSSAEILRLATHVGSPDAKFNEWDLGYELGRRGNVSFLTQFFRHANSGQREVIIIAMSRIKHNPEVVAFMRTVAFDNLRPNEADSEPRWYALQYLADLCDEPALHRLNGEQNFREGYPIGCMWWTSTIRTFGKCKYRPAIHHLIDSTNTMACLNISEAAIESLHELFPGKCMSKSDSLNKMHDCFLRVAGTSARQIDNTRP